MDTADRLRKILAVTDAALARLSVEDLQTELLDRIRTLLRADTAAVLLRDGDDLIASAACGLEEEVRQGVRVPMGQGFAGAIAMHRKPVLLERVDASTVSNPILWEKGIQRMLGVPLLSDEELLGVVHVGRLSTRAFDPQDVEVLQMAAERLAGATQARRLAVETAAVRLLERGLLPSRLPRLPGIELAARYVAAESHTVGGDWYDAFVGPSGELWLVVGDVAGHGLNAAVIMGRVKSALRSYTMLDADPARVLELTDRKVRHFEFGTMITVVCAVSTPPYDRFEVCSAGHPPPVLATPGGPARLLELKVGPPLGAVADAARTSTTVSTPPGAVVLLYTDGLIERREEPLEHGLHRLRDAVTADQPDYLCRELMRSQVGNHVPTDDIAVLAMRRT
jgi:putative methionine-R-sulfoxide reductase with GAF domain